MILLDALARAYLFAWLALLAIPLGCLAWLMVGYLTGGAWIAAIHRRATAATQTLPLFTLGFIPIALTLPHLYPWANAGDVSHGAVLAHRHVLYAPLPIVARSLAFLLGWSAVAYALPRVTAETVRKLSAAGLVVYFLTMSLAAVDWIASRETRWYSSTFGLAVITGQAVAGMAFLLATTPGAWQRAASSDVEARHDLGNLFLTSVVLWSYVNFMQYLIVWIGNSQEEITWFVHRTLGGWRVVGITMMLGHFAVPFVLLLFQPVKRSARALATVAGGLLLLRFLDTLWLVAPSSPVDAAGRASVFDPLLLSLFATTLFVFYRAFLSHAPPVPLSEEAARASA